MSNIHFYPRLDEDMLKACGCKTTDYFFSYIAPDGTECNLEQDSNNPTRVFDSTDIWQIRKDGLALKKTVVIEYPDVLKGPNGIIPKNARLLPCLLWSCPKLSTAGVIKPTALDETPKLAAIFQHTFQPGLIDGGILLRPSLYIGEPSSKIEKDEGHLMNVAGVLLGDIEQETLFDFTGESMDFPIEEFAEEGGPLWLMQFEDWDDPRDDPFASSSFSLLINIKHPCCPGKTGGHLQNGPLLMEILCEAYFLLFEKVRGFQDDSVWDDMISDSNLTADSICSVLYWFSQRGDRPFDWSTPESRMLSIKRIVDESFSEGEVNE